MNKKSKVFLWLLFLVLLPLVYIVGKIFIPHSMTVDLIISVGSYLAAVIGLMYKIDIRFYFFVQRLFIFFRHSYTSWSLSIRYNDVDRNTILNKIEDVLIQSGVRILQKDTSFICGLWNSRNVIHFRLDMNDGIKTGVHFYTSKIDVPAKEHKKKMTDLMSFLDKLENNIPLHSRADKEYEIDVEYMNKSPFYAYWLKSIPEEQVHQFNCIVKPSGFDDTVRINKNTVYIRASAFSELFRRLEYYLTLRAA